MPTFQACNSQSRLPNLRLGLGFFLIGIFCLVIRIEAQESVKSSSSQTPRELAEESIPWDDLTESAKSCLQDVISDTTLFQRLSVQQVHCDSNIYVHLARHPEILANMWELMGVTKLRIDRTDKYRMQVDDGQGTKAKMELIYGTPHLHLFFCEGTYQGSLIPTVSTGRAIIIIRSRYLQQKSIPTVRHQMDLFLQIDDMADQLIVKTLSYFFMKTADANFAETTQFLGQIDDIVRKNPSGMKRLSKRLTRVEVPIRNQFAELVESANAQYVRLARTQQKSVVLTQK